MTAYILDCCTLLNLYCGWGGLQNLNAIDGAFHIGTTVASEALYVRDYDSSGAVVPRRLVFKDLCRHCPMATLKLSSQQELALMVHLASAMDDGEAEGLAMAINRGHAFCSDDSAVQKIVSAERLQVRIVSTPELLQVWAENDPHKLASLPSIVRRATELGKFKPHRSSPYLAWWADKLVQ